MEENKIEQRYKGEKGRQYHQRRLVPNSAYQWVAKLRAKKISPNIKETDVVLEYGVGTGWNLAEIDCQKKIGFDLLDSLGPIVQAQGIEFIKETKSIRNSSVDVIVCHHVLEHLANPIEVLTEMKRLLRENGKLLLFVPFHKERRYRYFNSDDPSHHLYSWDVQTLGNIRKSCL
jgi:SAM-dependent methyltransferase